MSVEPAPVACTLTQSAAADQTLEWADLRLLAQSVQPIAAGVRMVFPIDLLSRIEELVRREAACCAFLDIRAAQDGGVLVVDLASENVDARAVISLLAGFPVT